MTIKRILPLFLCLITFSIAVNANNQSLIKKGILDLRGNKLEQVKEVEFTGEWEFYWQKLLLPKDFTKLKPAKKVEYIHVPAVWKSIEMDGQKLPAEGFATYRLKVLIDSTNEYLALQLGSLGTASKIFASGKLIYEAGKVAKSKEKAKPGYQPGVYSFLPDSTCFDIIVQVSNYHYCKGGIWNNFGRIGTEDKLINSWNRKIDISLLMIGCFLIFAIYHLGLYIQNQNFRYTLYFSIFCLVILARTMVVSETYILSLIPEFNWFALVKIEYFTLMAGTASFALFIYKFFHQEFSKKILFAILIASGILGLIILFTSPSFFTKLLLINQIVILLAASYILYVVVKALGREKRTATIMLIGFSILMLCVVNDILYTSKIINTTFLTSFGFIFFVISQAYMLSVRFSNLFVQTESLAFELEEINQNLEKKVEERTAQVQEQNSLLMDQHIEISEKNEELEQQNDEIKAQRDNIEAQHKIVSRQKKEITDSIYYARRIQNALMPSEKYIKDSFPNHFVFYRPKDIVSGDFYWAERLEDTIYIAAVDCTGHSVPGAMMSMLGIALLNEVVHKPEISSPAQILEEMRKKVKASLRQTGKKDDQRDGMDMALCMIDLNSKKMEFSGAYNPVYIFREEQEINLLEIKGDRQPVSIHRKEKEFTNHEFQLLESDTIYLFSDGYHDQMGGPKYSKFMAKNFKELLLKIQHETMEKQQMILEENINNWQGKYNQIDDMLVIGLKI